MNTVTPPTAPALTPVQILNGKIAEAHNAARSEERRLQDLYALAAREEFHPPANLNVAEFSRLQREHIDRPAALRMQLRNFNSELFTSNQLDVLANKPLLVAALAYLQQRHTEAQRLKAAPVVVAPKKKNGLVAAIENYLGDPILESAPEPPARSVPVGGLFGASEPVNVEKELRRITEAVGEFPADSFEQVTASLNSVAGALREQEPKPEPPKRMDKPWVAPLRFS